MNNKLRLKKTTDWFAAGEGFLKAMELLSDEAFKLFVFLCLKADRHTAIYHAGVDQLALAIRMPHTKTESCLAELQAQRVCSIVSTHRPELGCGLRIEDDFWPYQSSRNSSPDSCTSDYVSAIRQMFLDLGCTSGRFGPSEEAQARNLERRGVPLDVARDAMIMGACRKYVSWLNNGYSAPISSISYFEPVIGEFMHCSHPPGYREYMPFELKRLAGHWTRSLREAERSDPAVKRGQQPTEQSVAEIRDDDVATLGLEYDVRIGAQQQLVMRCKKS